MFEFVQSTKIPGSWRNIVKLAQECKALNEKNGRRAQDLRCPPKWKTIDGVYAIEEEEDGAIFLKCKLTDARLPLDHLTMQLPQSKELAGNISLALNFSRTRAMVQFKGTCREWSVLALFASAAAMAAQKDACDGKKGTVATKTNLRQRGKQPVAMPVHTAINEEDEVPPSPAKNRKT